MSDNEKPAERGRGGPSKVVQLGGEQQKSTGKPSKTQRLKYLESLPGHKDLGAGRDAAYAFVPKLGRRQTEVLAAIEQHGPSTADEIATKIGRHFHSTRPRASELYLLGEIVKTGQRRPSAVGIPQTVYRRATAEERALLKARQAAEAEHSEGAKP